MPTRLGCQDAIERIGRKLVPNDEFGDPTDEVLFNIQPRSCLIVGDLSQFQTNVGINENKFRSFELYRRSTARPEILTFDELLERARFGGASRRWRAEASCRETSLARDPARAAR